MLKKLFLNSFSQSVQFGSRWFLKFILLKTLDLSSFGLFSYLYGISTILSQILPFGSDIYIFKENKKKGNKKLLTDGYIIINFLFSIFFIIYLILVFFKVPFRGLNYFFQILILGYFLALNLITSSYLKSINLFIKELKAYIAFSIILLSLIGYIYVKRIKDINIAINGLIVINILLFSYLLYLINIKFYFSDFNKSFISLKINLKKRIYYGFQNLQSAIYRQSSTLILIFILTDELYGVYQSFLLLATPIGILSFSMIQVFINQLKKEITHIKHHFRKIMIFSVFIALLIFIVFYISKDQLGLLFKIDKKYIHIFPYLILTVSLQMVNSSYNALLIVLNKQIVRFYATLISSVLVIVLLLTIVNYKDIETAIIINLIATANIFIIYVIFGEINLRKVNDNSNFRS